MKSVARGLAIAASLTSLQTLADCAMPTLVPSIPDGTTATEDELLASQREVRNYIAAMDRYIACQNEELSTNGDNAASEYLFQMASRIGAARSEVDAVASRFNEAVGAFRAARPPARGALPEQSPLQQTPLQQTPLQQSPLQPSSPQQSPQTSPQQLPGQTAPQQPGLPPPR